jgi:ABC-type nitrate/sulfonate/bicarbonate transport system substrate-binding protein
MNFPPGFAAGDDGSARWPDTKSRNLTAAKEDPMTVRLSRGRALTILAAAPATLLPAPASAQASAVRIGSTPSDSFAQPYFAADQGYFTRAGLTATISNFTAGGPIVQACAAGAIDVGIADSIAIANAVHGGVPFALFAGSAFYSSSAPTTLLCVTKTSPLRTAKDIEGQTVAVANISSISTVAVKAWLEASGADLAKIKIFELPQAEMAAALVRGTVAAAFLNETFFTSERERLRVFSAPYDAVGKQFMISGWFATRDWLTRSADLAKRLTQAIYESSRWANGHHDQTAAILAKYSGMDVARIREIHRVNFATGLEPRMFQPVLDVATKYKLIEGKVSAADLIFNVA